jgi:hypothetical protein
MTALPKGEPLGQKASPLRRGGREADGEVVFLTLYIFTLNINYET